MRLSKNRNVYAVFFTLLLTLLGATSAFAGSEPFVTKWVSSSTKLKMILAGNNVVVKYYKTSDPSAAITDGPKNYKGTEVEFVVEKGQEYKFEITNLWSFLVGGSYSDFKLVEKWGNSAWLSLANAFKDVRGPVIAEDAGSPNLTNCTNLSSMFVGCRDFKDVTLKAKTEEVEKVNVKLSEWDVSNVRTFAAMFDGCSSFVGYQLQNWKMITGETFNMMFRGCAYFNPDLKDWKLPNARNYNLMFDACTKFKGKGLDKWEANGNIAKVVSFESMFAGCQYLEVDLGSWRPSKSKTFRRMFANARYSKLGELKNWTVRNATNFESMFHGCQNFNSDVSGWVAPPKNAGEPMHKAEILKNMFYGCSDFNQDVSQWDVSRVKDMSGLFNRCKKFKQNLKNWNVGQCEDMSSMFEEAGVFDADISGWDVTHVTNMQDMFKNCPSYNCDLSKWAQKIKNVTNFHGMFDNCSAISCDFSDWQVGQGTDFSRMFYGCKKMRSNLTNWKMQNATSTASMFSSCGDDFNIDVSGWDMRNVIDASYMFAWCKGFNQNISGWRMPKLQNIGSMFIGCEAFNQDISGWTVDLVKDMSYTFHGCKTFNQDLGGWNVENCENFENMFFGCTNLEKCDLSSWNTHYATNMAGMFHNARKFTSDLSQWDVSLVENMKNMFYGAELFNSNLEHWDVGNVSNMEGIFYDAKKFNSSLEKWKLSSALQGTTISLDNCGMGTSNYDKTLNAWMALGDKCPIKIQLGATGLRYTAEADAARIFLGPSGDGQKHWTIAGDIKESGNKTLKLKEHEVIINLGSDFTITAEVSPVDKQGAINWALDKVHDPKIVTLQTESGTTYEQSKTNVIKGNSIGWCYLRATLGSDDRVYDDLFIRVLKFIKELKFTRAEYEIPVNSQFALADELTILPVDATIKRLKWEVMQGSVITIDKSGLITAGAAEGDAKVKVSALDGSGIVKEITIKVRNVKATAIEIEPEELSLKVGDKTTLNLIFTPTNTTDKTGVVWTCKDPSYLNVDANSGKIEALAAGVGKTTDVTATYKGGLKATCHVRIQPDNAKLPTGLTLSPTTLEINVGEEHKIEATIIPSDAEVQDVLWFVPVEAREYVSVKKGVVKGLKPTPIPVTITAKAAGNIVIFENCRITVKEIPVTALVVDYPVGKSELEIPLNIPTAIPCHLEPSNASNKKVTWQSGDVSKIEVDASGRLVGKTVGSEIIEVTGKALGGHNITAICKVRVVDYVAPTKLKLPATISLNPGEKKKLAVEFEPLTATDRTLEWETDDEQIAKVVAGQVEAIQAGDTDITVRLASNHNIKAKCRVKVLPRITATGIELIPTLKLGVGATHTFIAKVLPQGATDQELTWKVTEGLDTKVEFDKLTKTIKAKQPGTAKVVVTLKNKPTITATCVVTVDNKRLVTGEIKFEKDQYEVREGETVEAKLLYTPTEANFLPITYTVGSAEIEVRPAAQYGFAEIRGVKVTTAPVQVTGNLAEPTKTFTTKVIVKANNVTPPPTLPLTSFDVISPVKVLKGGTAVIKLTYAPANTDLSRLEWTVIENPTKCTVSQEGIVEGLEEGSAKVRVHYDNLADKEVDVIVLPANGGGGITPPTPPLTGYTAPKEISVVEGGNTLIQLTDLQPNASADLSVLQWTTEGLGFCTVDNTGFVRGMSVGVEKVKIHHPSITPDKEVIVRVLPANQNKPALLSYTAPKEVVVVKDYTTTIVLTDLNPADPDLSALIWTTEGLGKCEVVAGVVKGKEVGEEYVYIDGVGARQMVKVKVVPANGGSQQELVPLQDFWVLNTDQYVVLNNTSYVQLRLIPTNADISPLTWISDDESICKVEKGIIKGVGLGSTRITVEDPGSKARQYVMVHVVAATTDIENIVLAKLEVGPNPFSSLLRIVSPEPINAKYELLNSFGQIVRRGDFKETELQIETETLPAGFYILRMTTDDGFSKIFKVVKQ